jgi:DeoR/GlpR family transcriptional regulator of sugar metabolism
MLRNPRWLSLATTALLEVGTERERLALTAASTVPLVGIVGLGGGGIMSTLARRLGPREQLAIITTALDVAVELANTPGIELTVPAGETVPGTQSLVGASVIRVLRSHRLDLAVVQADGVTEHGLSVHDPRVAETMAVLMERAAHVTVVAEARAIGHRARVMVPGPRLPHSLVTHTSADGWILERLAHAGILITRAG